ncbi:MAG: hypothetical protein REH83_03990 [Rickettsiella sp.]|nr:hypothetical protein [Rickettsiella sp.]
MVNNKPHLIFVGFHPSAVDAIDFVNYRISIIVHEYVADTLDASIRDRLTGLGVLKVPHNMNLEEYIDAMPEIEALAATLIEQHGHPKAFIALYEHVTLPAALLRKKFSVPGTSVATATLCRDKVKMKQCLQGTAIRYPQFKAVDSKTTLDEVKEFIHPLREKLVLKPRAQAASEGVFVFKNHAQLITHIIQHGLADRYQLEEFISGRLCHFDGVVRNGALIFFCASKYTTTCYDYVNHNVPMASITIDNAQLFNQAKYFTEIILRQVGLRDGTFHLEAFLVPQGEWVFLEVANRFGGAGVVPLMKKVYGVDLVKETILADMLEPSEITQLITTLDYNFSSAWLYIPIPLKQVCQVTAVFGIAQLPKVSIVASDQVVVGQWLNQSVGPFPHAGRFFIKDETYNKVKALCKKIVDVYRVSVTAKDNIEKSLVNATTRS